MSPAQAIRAATFNAADLIGRSQDVGTLKLGSMPTSLQLRVIPWRMCGLWNTLVL